MSGEALAAAAAALVGSRYRRHGRDPATGLDCVGVLAAALAAIGRPARLPHDYPLRSRVRPDFAEWAGGCGLAAARGPARAGDVLIACPGPCQLHVIIALGRGDLVHAHAGLRRVVRMPGPLAWPVLSAWRLS
jgi:cell wall-associated NlpC family hydrolase